MSDEAEESALQRATREAGEAEERLRRMKESLIPRDLADTSKSPRPVTADTP